MKTAVAIAAVAISLGTTLAPTAAADTDVVFIGGTGTGVVPSLPRAPEGFVKPFVPVVDTATTVGYNTAPWANPHAAVPAAVGVIAAQDKPTVVIGLSKGAQVARATEGFDGNPLTQYVLIGDPDDDRGVSRSHGMSAPKREFTHDTTIVVAEYDGVGDWPDRFSFGLAEMNALAGWATVHTQYGNGTKDDPLTRLDEAEVTETKNPNGTTLTRKLIPTRNLPITQGIRNTLKAFGHTTADDVVDRIDKHLRPMIDRGYSRNDTKPSTKKDDKSDDDKSSGADRDSSSSSSDAGGSSSDSSSGSES